MDSEQKRRILDVHMHLPTQGISLSEKKEILLKEMQKNGIDEGIVISDSAITSEIGNLKDCLELFSDTCYVHVVGGISPFFNYKEQCKLLDTALSEKKIVGIKLFCGHESFYLSDNILEPVYALAETYNVPMLFHSEKDSSQYASYFAVCEAVRQHPNITFVCCHCHYPNVEACFQRYKNVNNIVFDISSIADVQMTADMRKAVQSELQRHPDAIMFGSDYAGCSQADHLDFAMSLAVSDDIRSRLLYKTAYRVFHLA